MRLSGSPLFQVRFGFASTSACPVFSTFARLRFMTPHHCPHIEMLFSSTFLIPFRIELCAAMEAPADSGVVRLQSTVFRSITLQGSFHLSIQSINLCKFYRMAKLRCAGQSVLLWSATKIPFYSLLFPTHTHFFRLLLPCAQHYPNVPNRSTMSQHAYLTGTMHFLAPKGCGE
jgi:hypothetical protein